MKSTPLTNQHIALGAKMTDFAGYNMPVSYTGIKEEHQAVRQKLGIFDVSHMGEFIVRGKHALDLVQYVTSNDASKLKIGQAQYAYLPNETGGIIDDLLVYRLPQNMMGSDEDAFMLVVNASNIEKDWNWITSHNKFGAELINISYQTGLLAVQGPLVMEAIQGLTDINLQKLAYYTFQRGSFAGQDNVLISATGYTGAGGVELYARNEQIAEIWDILFRELPDLKPIGLGARDTLRLEMGYCLYGNDIDDTTSPLEAGLGWVTKFQKGDFVGKSFLLSQKEKGVSRKLVGFVANDRRVPRHGHQIEDEAGNVIGHVTSGTLAPSLEKPIGMGYVPIEFSKLGSSFFVNVGKKNIPVEVVKLPFGG
ncbi:MAG: glycine cleavage system aminomethyltransferase GcvT [Saprospiraceae bacterium]|nr:glycine cleavage system aminomethyltransferase GcvT [Saprospiraceae bacterium]